MRDINPRVLQFFSALSDRTRLRIVLSLVDGPKTVGQIYQQFGEELTLSAVSHQLRYLSSIDIVSYEKNGRQKTFRLSHDSCWCILKDALNHLDGKIKCQSCGKTTGI